MQNFENKDIKSIENKSADNDKSFAPNFDEYIMGSAASKIGKGAGTAAVLGLGAVAEAAAKAGGASKLDEHDGKAMGEAIGKSAGSMAGGLAGRMADAARNLVREGAHNQATYLHKEKSLNNVERNDKTHDKQGKVEQKQNLDQNDSKLEQIEKSLQKSQQHSHLEQGASKLSTKWITPHAEQSMQKSQYDQVLKSLGKAAGAGAAGGAAGAGIRSMSEIMRHAGGH